VRADAIDLEIEGTRLRVVCEDPAALATLRGAVADHVIDEPAPVGFAMRVPAGETEFHSLVDRSGLVLARVRTSDECLAVFGSHLAVLLPPPAGTVRLRARAVLLDESTAALAVFPLAFSQPLIERRLARSSLRVVDRLVVDIGPDLTLTMAPPSFPALGALPVPAGHTPAPLDPTPIDVVLVPELMRSEPTQADLVAFVAAATSPGAPRAGRLTLAEGLVRKQTAVVRLDDPAALYAALQRS
jgi:hypothetical protein